MAEHLIWYENLRRGDVARVGGKNASLGEMISALGARDIRVPQGFATTSDAYRRFLAANRLEPLIAERIAALQAGRTSLHEAGSAIRTAIAAGEWPADIADAIRSAYRELAERTGRGEPSVAVRYSATAEDLTDASFAGQQETFL
ncbi:MAG: phosphoenolpyruvate synthase, partial [Roseivivax sp.]|nr:phosphoenolpyruvate synthase [Roseivivax sp.]